MKERCPTHRADNCDRDESGNALRDVAIAAGGKPAWSHGGGLPDSG